jgi:hypothetical protein
MYPGVWTTYILLLFFAWLLVLSVSGCSPGAAWTTVNLGHFAVCTAFLLYISLLLLLFGSPCFLIGLVYSSIHLLLICSSRDLFLLTLVLKFCSRTVWFIQLLLFSKKVAWLVA